MRHTSHETFKTWMEDPPYSIHPDNVPAWWACWKAAVEYGIEFGKESEHPKPTENTVSEKREDHPMFKAFLDLTLPNDPWVIFLAGAKAEEARAEAINAKHTELMTAIENILAVSEPSEPIHDKLDAILDLAKTPPRPVHHGHAGIHAKLSKLLEIVEEGVKVHIELKTPPTG